MTQISTTHQGSKQAADKNAIRPFPHVNAPEAELTELRRRINATKWPERGDGHRRHARCAASDHSSPRTLLGDRI